MLESSHSSTTIITCAIFLTYSSLNFRDNLVVVSDRDIDTLERVDSAIQCKLIIVKVKAALILVLYCRTNCSLVSG